MKKSQVINTLQWWKGAVTQIGIAFDFYNAYAVGVQKETQTEHLRALFDDIVAKSSELDYDMKKAIDAMIDDNSILDNTIHDTIMQLDAQINNALKFGKDKGGELINLKQILFVVHNNIRTFLQYADKSKVENHKPNDENDLQLPFELDTPRARKYFTRAIDAGYMEKTDNGYRWLFGNKHNETCKARLGFFCSKVFDTPRPISKLEEFFNIKNLSSAITGAEYEVKRVDVIKWREEINNTIFND